MIKGFSKFYSQKVYCWNRESYFCQCCYIDIWSFVFFWLIWFWVDKKDWSYWGGVIEEKKNFR